MRIPIELFLCVIKEFQKIELQMQSQPPEVAIVFAIAAKSTACANQDMPCL